MSRIFVFCAVITTALAENHKLERGLSLTQATAINMIDMVGIGPFVTMSIIVSLMHGPASVLAWLLGATLAYMDGMVWAELGARWPEAGGSYVFLKRLFGEKKGGRLMSFLFIWQTTLQAPLVIASGAIGFANYFSYLIPLNFIEKKMVSGGLVILLVALPQYKKRGQDIGSAVGDNRRHYTVAHIIRHTTFQCSTGFRPAHEQLWHQLYTVCGPGAGIAEIHLLLPRLLQRMPPGRRDQRPCKEHTPQHTYLHLRHCDPLPRYANDDTRCAALANSR